MSPLRVWLKSFFRPPWPVIVFPHTGFDVIEEPLVEEEGMDGFSSGDYCPMVIGDVLDSRYQVVGKLGFGVSSTVWLARDMRDHRHVALKVHTRDEDNKHEFEIYQQLSKPSQHHGRKHVRDVLDTFTLPRPGGDHQCLVQKPLWESLQDLHNVMPNARLEVNILKSAIKQMLLALDYLHTECKLVHTDIKSDNIMQELNDISVLKKFVQGEVKNPSPRKIVSDRTIYLSRLLDPPKKFGRALLCDFGEAVQGEEKRNHNAQPEFYRSPEVMLKANWSYPADIWNLGTMIWQLLEGQPLFTGQHPTLNTYLTRAHIAEIIGLLGPPPNDLIQKGARSPEFFDQDGKWKIDDVEIQPRTLEESECCLEGEDKDKFLVFIRGMLTWRQEDRKTAAALLHDPWLNS
ncbi:unnamed protein product [Penicillium salamii]|nr:unnamed protein product [Penicillium salamii]CAG8194045.1 unnamed protein product [Penicillium salamii]CAG8416970.1 unnamed protein product [Penicillium salamii]